MKTLGKSGTVPSLKGTNMRERDHIEQSAPPFSCNIGWLRMAEDIRPLNLEQPIHVTGKYPNICCQTSLFAMFFLDFQSAYLALSNQKDRT